jgi:RimJ/RimL family protein N-acetyltransferase
MDQDHRVTKYIPGPWADPYRHRAFVQKRMSADYPEGLGYWSVFNRFAEQDVLLGWVLLLPYHRYSDEVEIGWRFIHSSWGKGYATEAAAVVLGHAFRTVKLQKVVADIHPLNLSSIAVAEKLGMKYLEDRDIDGSLSRSYQIIRSCYQQ